MTERKKILIELLKEYFEIVETSATSLQYSFEKCSEIGLKDIYDLEELESFDALTSRFARTSDIFTRKMLRTIFELLDEYPETMADSLNNAEKNGLIKNADRLSEIRKLRNDIAHEYWMESLKKNFERVLDFTPDLLGAINSTASFCKQKDWL